MDAKHPGDTMTPVKRDPLLTVRQLAEHEALDEEDVRNWLRQGLPHYRLGKVGGIRVRLSEWMAWLAGRRSVAG